MHHGERAHGECHPYAQWGWINNQNNQKKDAEARAYACGKAKNGHFATIGAWGVRLHAVSVRIG